MAKSKKVKKAVKASAASPTIAAQMVPIAAIDFAEDNREQIDPGKLTELGASLQEHGLRDDIHLRPHPAKKGKFECVDGERRTRAAKAIGWKEISAKVEEMDDAKAKELRLVHHLQREDLSPWDEARQLTALKELNPDIRIEDLAVRVGRGPQWVAQRLAIDKLIPLLRKLVTEQNWPLVLLPLLARVPVEAQPGLLADIEGEQENGYAFDNNREHDGAPVPTQRELEDFLDRRSRLLTAAPWKMDDADLVPKAGACAFCPKRSSAQALLFPDLADDKDDRCLDAACWNGKQLALVALNVTKLKEKGEEPILLSGTYGSRANEDNAELRELIGKDIEIKDQHHYVECKKKDPGAKPAIVATGEKAGTLKYVRSRAVDANPSKARPIDQDTGKAAPPSTKQRLTTLKQKRQCRAVELWVERLEKLEPPHAGVLDVLLIVLGTNAKCEHRNPHDWADVATTKPQDLPKLAWEQLFPIFESRLKRFGAMEDQAADLWAEAEAQADAIHYTKEWNDCWTDAVAEIKMPKTLAKEGVLDEDAAA